MIQSIPAYIPIVFITTTLLSYLLFMKAVKKSTYAHKQLAIMIGLAAWVIMQSILSYNHFYFDTAGNTPPPFPFLGFIPTFILMIYLFNTTGGKKFIDSLPLKDLTAISIVRIPVEIVLWWLFLENLIPAVMTFEGLNFDIIAGITAPIIIYLGYTKNILSNKALLVWNIVSLMLLLNIIILAVFSFPTFMQLLAFDQPNIGLLYFPYFWLPSFIVPIVLFSHVVSIRQLLLIRNKGESNYAK